MFKILNSARKIINKDKTNKKLYNSNNVQSSKNINKKLRLNNQTFVTFIPSIQKSIKVKKKQILNLDNSNKKNDKEEINLNKNKIRTKNEQKNTNNKESKKNLSFHNIKFCLNQKIAKLKKIKNKNKLNKFNGKIPINKNKFDKVEKGKDNNINNLDEKNKKNQGKELAKIEKNENEKKESERAFFKINSKLVKNIEINKTSLNNNLKLIKDNKNKNNSKIYYVKKKSNITKNKKEILALNIDNSNSVVNYSKLSKNMSGNNLIYAPKKGINRQKSHEKNLKNIYSNMSYEPDKLKEIIKKRNNLRFNNKKAVTSEMNNFLEKNNSFSGKFEGINQISIENENKLISPRINLLNNYPKIEFNILTSENNNNNPMKIGDLNFDYTSEKILGNNNNIFIPNRLTTTEKINYNNFFPNQNFHNSLNLGVNLNTDFNNYDRNNLDNFNLNNIIDRRTSFKKMNIFPPNYNFSIISPFNSNINQTNLINLYNNNFLNFNTIQGRPSSVINYQNYNINESLFQYPNGNEIINTNKSPSINIEDLIILQEKLKSVLLALNKTHVMANECFEFLNFYYNSSIYCQLEKIFNNPFESNIVRISINCNLISIIICYDYSFEIDIATKSYVILDNIMKLNYKNLVIIYDYILTKISSESKNNIWVKKLSDIINSFKKKESIKLSGSNKISLINNNTNIIFQNILFILKNFRTMRNEYFLNFIINIAQKTYSQINIFFREYILRTNNLQGSILASVLLRSGNKNYIPVPTPYVRTKNNKNYSLVLDLDETLVHFKEIIDKEGNGIMRIRPGINEFLEEVGKYYELIIFTTATQDYADALIDAIEEDKIYFEHRFYRNHAIIMNNDFVKDLNRIGRPLDKIIIVDNMPQNFRLQKENGIMIKAFWGEDVYDTVLYDLIPILVNIAKDGGDVRKGLLKYKEDILKYISSNIS